VEEKTVRLIIKGIIVSFVFLVATIAIYDGHEDRLTSECIKNGNEPIECRMAIGADGYSADRMLLQVIKELNAERK